MRGGRPRGQPRTLLTRRVLFGIAACLGLLVGGMPAQAQEAPWRGDAVAWQYDRNLPSGTVRGLVLTVGGEPIIGAAVSLYPHQHGAATDSTGRVELTGLAPGPIEIRVRRIGYKEERTTILIPSDAGVSIAVILADQPLGGACGDTFGPNPNGSPLGMSWGDGVSVVVFHGNTSRSPESTVTLRLERGAETWAQTRPIENAGPGMLLFVPHRVETRGTYVVQVSAPGYRTQRIEVSLDVETGVCKRRAHGRHHVIRLYPNPG